MRWPVLAAYAEIASAIAAAASPPYMRDCSRRSRSARHLYLHHLQLPPLTSPGSSASSSRAHPALLGPCTLQRRPCTLSIILIPASCVAGEAVPVPFASSPMP